MGVYGQRLFSFCEFRFFIHKQLTTPNSYYFSKQVKCILRMRENVFTIYPPPLDVWAWLLVEFETEIFQGPSRCAQLKTFTLTLPHPGVETRSPIWKPQLEHTADRTVVSFLLFHNPDSYGSEDFIIKIPYVKVLVGSFQDPQSSDSNSRKFIDLYKVLECVYKTRLNKLES